MVTTQTSGTGATSSDASFVGRARELACFRRLLRSAFEGKRQVMLLAGEPGIGKTRCAEMFAELAEDQGALTLWGRCYEEPGAPPYWPWVQILRDCVQSCSANELELMVGHAPPDAASVIPDFFGRPDESLPIGPVLSEHARFRAFDTIARFLAKSSQQTPLVLIIDNLHWADAPSLSLLEFLCQELAHSRVLVIGTYRDVEISRRHPLPATLGGLSRDGAVERVRLTGLPRDSIVDLAEKVLGIVLPPSVIDAIYGQTDGNPLFVIELLKVLREESAAADLGPIAVRIPDSVRETIGRRLSHLSEHSNDVLAVASVLGRRFTATEVAVVADRPFEHVMQGLQEAAQTGLIEPTGEGADGYQFKHALIREVLHDELPALERLKLHGRAGDALADIHRADLEPVLTRLAHHYSEAAPLGYAEKAVTFELEAAARAMRMCAYEGAVAHDERALALLSLSRQKDDARIVRLYYHLGACLVALGDTKSATEALLQALKHGVRLRSPLLVDVITRLIWTTSDSTQSPIVPLLEKALAILPPGDSAERAKTLAALAFALRTSGEASRAESLVAEAIAMGHRLGDAGALAICSQLAVMALRGRPQTLHQRLALSEQYVALAPHDTDDPEGHALAYSFHALDLVEAGHLEELERMLCRYRALDISRFGLHHYHLGALAIQLALLRGEWQDLDKKIEELYAEGTRMRRADAEGVYGAQMFALNRDLGRLPALRAAVEHFARDNIGRAWLPGLILTCVEVGLIDEARRVFERVARTDFAAIPQDDMFETCLIYCAETCHALDDSAAAAKLYELLAPFAGRLAQHPRVVCFGATDLYLALLAVTKGAPDAARGHFDAALRMNRAIAAWPWVARTLYHYGSFLIRGEGTETRTRGRALLADAEQLAARLGMATLVDAIGARLNGANGTVYPDGLTAREVEVLRLIAIGRSNRDISMVLSISLNTVATHVRSILSKTGSANRTEAAAYAIREGLRDSA